MLIVIPHRIHLKLILHSLENSLQSFSLVLSIISTYIWYWVVSFWSLLKSFAMKVELNGSHQALRAYFKPYMVFLSLKAFWKLHVFKVRRLFNIYVFIYKLFNINLIYDVQHLCCFFLPYRLRQACSWEPHLVPTACVSSNRGIRSHMSFLLIWFNSPCIARTHPSFVRASSIPFGSISDISAKSATSMSDDLVLTLSLGGC